MTTATWEVGTVGRRQPRQEVALPSQMELQDVTKSCEMGQQRQGPRHLNVRANGGAQKTLMKPGGPPRAEEQVPRAQTRGEEMGKEMGKFGL